MMPVLPLSMHAITFCPRIVLSTGTCFDLVVAVFEFSLSVSVSKTTLATPNATI